MGPVKIKGEHIAFPTMCVCCGGASDANRFVSAESSSGDRRRAEWQVPFCKACEAHAKADQDLLLGSALSTGQLGVFVGLPILVGAIAAAAVLGLRHAEVLRLDATAAMGIAIAIAAVLTTVGILLQRPRMARLKQQRQADGKARVASLMSPTCSISSGDAVAYTWDGDQMNTFEFHSPAYEKAFRHLNQEFVVR